MLRLAHPAHPGQFIKMEFLDSIGLSMTAAAKGSVSPGPRCPRS